MEEKSESNSTLTTFTRPTPMLTSELQWRVPIRLKAVWLRPDYEDSVSAKRIRSLFKLISIR